MLFTLIIPIEVIYAKESLGTTSAGYGILLASWGAGIFLGSLLYLRIKNRSAWLLVVELHLRDRRRLPRSRRRGDAAGRLPDLRDRRHRQRHPVDRGDDRAPGADGRDYQARDRGMMESLGAAMPGFGFLHRRRDRRPLLSARRLCGRRRGPGADRARRAPAALTARSAAGRTLAGPAEPLAPRVAHGPPRACRQPPRALGAARPPVPAPLTRAATCVLPALRGRAVTDQRGCCVPGRPMLNEQPHDITAFVRVVDRASRRGPLPCESVAFTGAPAAIRAAAASWLQACAAKCNGVMPARSANPTSAPSSMSR